MPSANPLEQLRRRMQSHATPAAFAALAEEHRRAGHLDEAIAVCRDGLSRYPTYVSARVTLGRALLDSGAALDARAELEQAVAQAPDNLAAVRALDAARAACAALPVAPPPPGPAADDLAPEADGVDSIDVDAYRSESEGGLGDAADAADLLTAAAFVDGPDVSFEALATGADGPQEFGLTPDWTLPDAPPPSPEVAPAADVDLGESPLTEALDLHADAPTTYFTAPHPQGEEPAGIWSVPAADSDQMSEVHVAGEASLTATPPVFSWAIDTPAADDVQLPPAPVSSLWDDAGVEPPIADVSAAAGPGDEAASAGMWGGLFEEPVGDGAEPASFAGWDAPGPTTMPDLSSWATGEQSDGPATGLWAAPIEVPAADVVTDAVAEMTPSHEYAWDVAPPASPASVEPSAADLATDGLAEPAAVGEVEAAADRDDAHADGWLSGLPSDDDLATVVVLRSDLVADAPIVRVDEGPSAVAAMVASPVVDEADGSPREARPSATPDAPDVVATPASHEATWAGSVASALDEVFRLAGQASRTTEGRDGNPDDPHHAAMATAAVEAAREDAAEGGADAPTLASLQQMLDAVRARRAALFVDPRTH